MKKMRSGVMSGTKLEALEAYKEAKKRYLENMTEENWIAFCEAERLCMRLGVRI